MSSTLERSSKAARNKKLGRSPFARVPTPVSLATSDDTRLAYTMREVGLLFGLSERTIYSLIRRGELRAVRIGRAVRIPSTELTRFLEGASPLEAP